MLLSRLARTVYWFGRYIERADDLSRAVLAHEQLSLDMPPELFEGWQPLLALCEPAAGRSLDRLTERDAILRLLITDTSSRSSVSSIMAQAREDLRMTRPLIPTEAWSTLNAAHLALLEVSLAPSAASLTQALLAVLSSCEQINGQIAATMNHDDAYRFLRIGRYLERADMLLRLATLANAFERPRALQAFEDLSWASLLTALGAYQMYRRSHHGRVDSERAFFFLLIDEKFPRSLNHCITQVQRELAHLPDGARLDAHCNRCRAALPPSAGRADSNAYATERLGAIAELAAALDGQYFG
jgi:uncharacterized alpha-E superfamily protein